MTPETMIPSARPLEPNRRLLQAKAWSLSGYAFSQFLRFASSLVLTRFLLPDMFGIMAIANLLMVSLTLLSDQGLRRNLLPGTDSHAPGWLDTAWTVQILRGALLALAALGVAALLYLAQDAGLADPARAYGHPLLPPAIACLAAASLIAGFQSIRLATDAPPRQQGKALAIELAGQAAGIVVSLGWAWVSPSIWALVAGSLAMALTSTLASHLLLPARSRHLAWNRTALAKLLGFDRWVLLSSTIGLLVISADRLFLAAVVDAHLLGLYTIGRLIVTALENGVARLFVSVSLPAMSEAARCSRADLRILYHKLQAPLDLFLFLAAGFLFTGGKHLVALLYDTRYAQAGSILAVLALAIPSLRFAMAYQLYLALGLPHLMSLISVVRLAALVILLPTGFWLAGFTGALWAMALHNFLTAPFVFYFNWRLGIASLSHELRPLPYFPLGLALGWLTGFFLR